MIRHIYKLALCALMISSPLMAKLPEKGIPIQIQSDTASFDSLKGVAIHRGSVIMTQGDRQVLADELTIIRNARGDIEEIRAIGEPAQYEGILQAEKPQVLGQAQTILYHPTSEQLVLEGQAELQQEQDVFKGPHIQYDIPNKLVTSHPSPNGRTVIVLQPR